MFCLVGELRSPLCSLHLCRHFASRAREARTRGKMPSQRKLRTHAKVYTLISHLLLRSKDNSYYPNVNRPQNFKVPKCPQDIYLKFSRIAIDILLILH